MNLYQILKGKKIKLSATGKKAYILDNKYFSNITSCFVKTFNSVVNKQKEKQKKQRKKKSNQATYGNKLKSECAQYPRPENNGKTIQNRRDTYL